MMSINKQLDNLKQRANIRKSNCSTSSKDTEDVRVENNNAQEMMCYIYNVATGGDRKWS